jgi:DNA-nicking Smr family endonuclease
MIDDTENSDFAAALNETMGDVSPIKQDDSAVFTNITARRDQDIQAKQLKRATIIDSNEDDDNPLSLSLRKAIKPEDMLSFKRPGIQDGVYKNLRLGKYALEGRIELQRMRINDCRTELFKRLNEFHDAGVRAVLIKHGRGENSKPIPGYVKSFVAQWLSELDIVIAYHSAQRQHGGLAATYVLLKKHPNQKMINREKFYKRNR